jgi:hypothetical protein
LIGTGAQGAPSFLGEIDDPEQGSRTPLESGETDRFAETARTARFQGPAGPRHRPTPGGVDVLLGDEE